MIRLFLSHRAVSYPQAPAFSLSLGSCTEAATPVCKQDSDTHSSEERAGPQKLSLSLSLSGATGNIDRGAKVCPWLQVWLMQGLAWGLPGFSAIPCKGWVHVHGLRPTRACCNGCE